MLFGEIRVDHSVGGTGGPSSLTAGDHFGQLASQKATRNQSSSSASRMVAVQHTGLLRVSAADLGRTIQRSQLEAAGDKAMFVVSCPMFSKLPWERLLRLVQQLQPRRYALGETIALQGDTPIGLYILQEGRCSVSRDIVLHDGGRRRTRTMHLETLMPRDTFGGDALLQGALRNYASLVAEQEVLMLFLQRVDFNPSQLSEDALRMLKLNAKLYRPDDEALRQRYYNQLEWDRAKHHYCEEVLAESRARKSAGRRW